MSEFVLPEVVSLTTNLETFNEPFYFILPADDVWLHVKVFPRQLNAEHALSHPPSFHCVVLKKQVMKQLNFKPWLMNACMYESVLQGEVLSAQGQVVVRYNDDRVIEDSLQLPGRVEQMQEEFNEAHITEEMIFYVISQVKRMPTALQVFDLDFNRAFLNKLFFYITPLCVGRGGRGSIWHCLCRA